MATKKTTAARKTTAPKTASAKKPAATKPATTKTADKMMSQIDAALAVLKKARKPMSCKKMVEAMPTAKVFSMPSRFLDFAQTKRTKP